jgi:hypothetical protein
MNSRNFLLALSTALALGLFGTSLAQASDRDRDFQGDGRDFHVGPVGQILNGGVPAFINGRSAPAGAYGYGPAGGSAYGFAPHRPVYKHSRYR